MAAAIGEVKNPNKSGEAVLREPKEILEEMGKLDEGSGNVIKEIKKMI